MFCRSRCVAGSGVTAFRPLILAEPRRRGHVLPRDKMQTFKILVVDDFELFRRSIRFILGQRPEFQVIGEASDGLEAIQKAVELKPHLILLDAFLPKMNGIDAARQIRKLAPESKILLMNYESNSDLVQETRSEER